MGRVRLKRLEAAYARRNIKPEWSFARHCRDSDPPTGQPDDLRQFQLQLETIMAVVRGAKGPDWNPRPLRWPFLASFVLSICSLIFLLEFAVHVLPSLSDKANIPHFDVTVDNSPGNLTNTAGPHNPYETSIAVVAPITPRRPRYSHYAVGRGSTNETYPILNGTLASNNTNDLHNDPDNYQDSAIHVATLYWWPIVHVFESGRFDAPHLFSGPLGSEAGYPCFCEVMSTELDSLPNPESRSHGPSGTALRCKVELISPEKACPTCNLLLGEGATSWQISFLDNDCFQRWIEDAASLLDSRRCPSMRDEVACPHGNTQDEDNSRPANKEAGIPVDDLTTILDVVGTITATTTLAGSTTVVTSVVTGANGAETTLLRTATLPGEVSVYTTRTTTHMTEYPRWRVPRLETKTDFLGRPTATISELGAGVIRTLTSMTLRDGSGAPTATVTTRVPATSKTTTLYGTTRGVATPTATVVEYPTFPSPYSGFGPVPDAVADTGPYFAGFFAPVLVAVLVSLWAAVISSNVKRRLPFTAMTRTGGAAASDSLNLNSGGLGGNLYSFRLLWKFRDPVSLLADMLVLLSAAAVVFSSDAIGLKLIGSCKVDYATGCGMALGEFLGPVQKVETLLATMVLVVVSISFS